MAGKKNCKHRGPEHCHDEALQEPDHVGKGKEKAQVRHEHEGAKEDGRRGCHEDSSNEDGTQPKPEKIWLHAMKVSVTQLKIQEVHGVQGPKDKETT